MENRILLTFEYVWREISRKTTKEEQDLAISERAVSLVSFQDFLVLPMYYV